MEELNINALQQQYNVKQIKEGNAQSKSIEKSKIKETGSISETLESLKRYHTQITKINKRYQTEVTIMHVSEGAKSLAYVIVERHRLIYEETEGKKRLFSVNFNKDPFLCKYNNVMATDDQIDACFTAMKTIINNKHYTKKTEGATRKST